MSIDLGQSLNKNKHVPHPWFIARNDELVIAGESLSNIVRRMSRTPFYVYDSTVIERKISLLRQHLPRQIKIHYAIKANPMLDVVKHVCPLVDGLDVASEGELRIARQASSTANISFAGPAKRKEELLAAVNANITINIESERELLALKEIAENTKHRPKICIRVNPNFELKTSGMKMSGGPKPFGIDAERVPDILRSLHTLPVEFRGFHIFSGSQNLHAEAIVEAQTLAYELAVSLARYAPTPLQELNLGGGFGIPYFPGDLPLDLIPIADNLSLLLAKAATQLPGATLIIELGRYLVGECGVYVCQVVDRKVSRGQTFLITDGGMHHHLAASGNFGQVIRKNFPVLVGNHVVGQSRETVNVVGPLCTPLDVLAQQMEMAYAEVGDLIVVLQSGAYGLTASPQSFLSQPLAAELLL